MNNEILFIITATSTFSFVFYSFFWGRRWLYAAITINLIAITIFGAELVSIFGRVTNVGNIFYAAVFFAGQLLVEHYGKDEGKKSIWLGFSSVLSLIIMGQVMLQYLPHPESLKVAEALGAVFTFAPRIALASLLAYLCSQSLNIYIYSYLSHIKEKKIWL